MHERAPVTRAAAELLTEVGDTPVARVRVAIAPDVSLEIVADAWASATAGTPLDGVPVEWVPRHPALRCLDCGDVYAGGKLDPCPHCGGDGLVVEEVPIARVESWTPAPSPRVPS